MPAQLVHDRLQPVVAELGQERVTLVQVARGDRLARHRRLCVRQLRTVRSNTGNSISRPTTSAPPVSASRSMARRSSGLGANEIGRPATDPGALPRHASRSLPFCRYCERARRTVPGIAFGDPQIVMAGESHAQLMARGARLEIGEVAIEDQGRARVMRSVQRAGGQTLLEAVAVALRLPDALGAARVRGQVVQHRRPTVRQVVRQVVRRVVR